MTDETTPADDADAPATEVTEPATKPTEPTTEAPAAEAPAPPASAASEVEAAPKPHREALLTRGILPLALPFVSAIATAIWVVNISRAFLAGGKTGALVIVMIVTITIMAGAAYISARPRMQASTQTLLTVALIGLIVSAGLVSLGPSEHAEGSEGGFKEPTGAAVATLTVDALPSLKFQADEFTTSAGINEIDYVNKGGNHTLAFADADPEVNGFLLTVSGTQTDTSKVGLKTKTYTIYCTIPGHRAAGMEASLTVNP